MGFFCFFVWLTLNTPHPHQLNHLFWGLLITPSVVLGEDLARTPGVKMHLARETGESANQSVPGPLLHFITLLQGSYSSLCCAHFTDCKSHVHTDFQKYILFTVLQFPLKERMLTFEYLKCEHSSSNPKIYHSYLK